MEFIVTEKEKEEVSRRVQLDMFMLNRVIEEAVKKLDAIHKDVISLQNYARTQGTSQTDASFIDKHIRFAYADMRHALSMELAKY